MPNEFSSNALTRRVRSREERPPQVVQPRGGALRGPVNGGPPPVSSDLDAMSPKKLLRGLTQHLMTAVVLGLVVGGLGAAAAYYFVPAPFEAKALIQVKTAAPKLVFNTAENLSRDNSYVRTQIALITSDIVVRKALARPGVSDVELFRNVENPRIYLRNYLRASNGRSQELIELTLTGEDPRGLATVLHAIHTAYIDEIVNVEQNHRAMRLSNLKQILQDREEQIRSQRIVMGKIAEVVGTSTNSDVATVQATNTLETMSQMRQNWLQKKIELLREQNLLKAMESSAKDQFVDVPEALVKAYLAENPEVQRLEGQLAAKESLLIETEKRVTNKDHPIILDYRGQINALNQSLATLKERLRPQIEQKLHADVLARSEMTLQDRRTNVEILRSQEESLREEFERLQKEASKLNTTSFELDDKKEQIDSLEKFSSKIQEEIHALEVELNAPPRVQVLQEAEPPIHRDTKRRLMATAGAGVGGFALVCFLIAFAEARLRRVMTVDDVSDKLRVMGQVPIIPAWASRTSRAAKTKKGRFWHDMLTESIDAARTLLVHDAEQEDVRMIMVVSAVPSEGKTTLSCHIASSLARAGRKVVLVDCDLRRPNVHRVFNLPNKQGFCEVLLGKAELDDVIQTSVPGSPAILSAGHITATVSPLLGMENAEHVFQALRERFEFVIVDTSPIMLVHDTLVVAKHMDAAIVAVRKQVSRQPKIAAIVDRLQSLEVPVLGTVAIGLDSESQDYGSSYYQGYSKYYAAKRPQK